VFCNDFIEKLGKAVIHGTKSINITLLENITKNYHEFPLPFERIPELTDDIIGKTTCFLAIVYQNKDIYSLVKKLIYTTDKQINNFIVNMIGPYFPEGEIVGGDDTQLVTRKKNTNIQVNPTLFFIFSLCCMLFFSFISYNYILLFQTELQNNTAFAFVKDVGSAAMTCNFERIHLSDTESSILKYMKYMKVVDIKLINTFEKTLKLRQCVLDPKDVFKTELFNQNIRSEKRDSASKGQLLNIHTNFSPSEIENKQLISKSLALVPSSTTAMLVPTNTMIQYIEDYNTEVYNKIEDKISSDLKTIRDPAALSLYFENLGKMDAKDFKMYFEKEGISDSTQIPTTADLKNILSIFSGSANMFKLFIQGYAGMNIMDIVHTDFKKRMSAIHADILHKKVDLDKYISDLVTDTGTLAKYSIGFYNLLAWFLFLSLKFSAATYYFAKHLKRKQTRTERLT
jgi:hypothetical protein